jgi:intein-encoded DNA endonuclease-like protein
MHGKPFQSKLLPYFDKIKAARNNGLSYQKIAKLLEEEHGLYVDQSTIFSFVKTRSKKRKKVITIQDNPNSESFKKSLLEKQSKPDFFKKGKTNKQKDKTDNEDFVFDFNPDEPIY